jgi:hypothetical protein
MEIIDRALVAQDGATPFLILPTRGRKRSGAIFT